MSGGELALPAKKSLVELLIYYLLSVHPHVGMWDSKTRGKKNMLWRCESCFLVFLGTLN